jgi:ribosomal-protein-alanine N-acetyltransferase
VLSVVIRDYKTRDFQDIVAIEKEAFSPKNPAYDVYIYLTHGSDLFVADIGGKIIGFIVLMEIGREAKILSFAVKNEFRRMGIGSMLLDIALKRCREKGKTRIFLEVRVSNKVAQALYKKKGFEIVETIPNYYSDGENAYLMALNLTGQ